MGRIVTRMELFFSGRVQGVGFRYTTFQVAQGFQVSGAVKNLADGRVWLLAEGSSAEVSAFITEVKRRLSPFIHKVEEATSTSESVYQGFRIAH